MNMLANTNYPEVALALSQPETMTKLLSLGTRPLLAGCLQRLDCAQNMLDPPAQALVVNRIHLGNEFCERLLPTPSELLQVQQQAQQLELDFCLVTPMLTDAGFKRLDALLPLLAEGAEVVINDWGTLQQLRADYPGLVPVLGGCSTR